ncbi:MAG: undecaprenyl-phosphate glucose phosphotransferase [Anaerolineae bacterium]|nr:undecaprenyl-phosphate glucose phosphotransferase [Anaerolineae bacterium]
MRTRRRAPWWVVLSDILLISVSVLLAYWARYELQWFRDISYHHPLSAYVPFSLLFTALMLLAFQMDRVYQQWRGCPWLDQVYRIINAVAKSVVVLFAITFFLDIFGPVQYSRALFLQAGLIVIPLLSLARLAQNGVEGWLRSRGIGVARVIIVGAGEAGRTVMRAIVARPELGYQVIGFVDDNPDKGSTDIGRFKALGPLRNLPRLIDEETVDEVIITLPWMYHRKIMSIVRECERRQVSARIVPDLFQMSLSRVDVDDLGGVPLIGVREVGFGRGALLVKRGMDVAGAAIGLTLGAPLLALTALAIRLDSPGPIVFRQTRVGMGGRYFEMYKFRSMREGAEAELEQLRELDEVDGVTFKMRDDPRQTRVGRFLRRTSLDELPQLWNVLRGEMSLVGPRPPVLAEVSRYVEWHKKRLQVRPGMTGLWQVSGRSLLSFDEMVLLDVYYIENWSLWLDFKILLRTIPKVLFGDGAY